MAEIGNEEVQYVPPAISQIAIRPLDSTMSRAAFFCSKPELTHYFTGTGSQPRTLAHDIAKETTVAHVMVHRETDEILGFFTLSNYSIPRDQLPSSKLRSGQTADVSTTLLGRMAIASKLEGKGFGGRLLISALAVAYQGSRITASSAIVVDPKDDDLINFYERYRFTLLRNSANPLRMFLPMGTALQLLQGDKSS